FIGGGLRNFCQGSYGAIGGGCRNVVDGHYGTVSGGATNFAAGFAAVAGGADNRADGGYSMIPGGKSNNASAFYSFAAGYRARASHQGAFVWADSTEADFASTLSDQFNVRASNGVRVVGSADMGTLTISPLNSGANKSSQIYLTEGESSTYGMFVQYDGSANQLKISGKDGAILSGPHLVIARDASRVGVGRTPAANALEVEGNASKTTAGEWLANSDASIKTDVRTITNAVETLSRLRPVRFRYTGEYKGRHPSIEDRDYCNYIAQEYRAVFPESVVEDGEGLLMIDTYNTQPYLVRAVQELDGQLQELRRENAELRRRLDTLEAAR
nr:tail fiber domain-containing protein [Kiritimatiellia bacterium]